MSTKGTTNKNSQHLFCFALKSTLGQLFLYTHNYYVIFLKYVIKNPLYIIWSSWLIELEIVTIDFLIESGIVADNLFLNLKEQK